MSGLPIQRWDAFSERPPPRTNGTNGTVVALRHQALHDSLTGLPNRALLMDTLRTAIGRLRRRPGYLALVAIDLDRFRRVNNSLGHACGDELLAETARRLRAAARPGDTVGRLGGDEFVVLCEYPEDVEEVVALADRMAEVMAQPLKANGHHVVLTASIGIAVTHSPAADADAVLSEADLAMYRAKEQGRDRWELFDNRMRRDLVERHAIEEELRRALPTGQLAVVYQPQIRLADERAIGAEALLRWRHPVLGRVPTQRFIQVAEDAGLIVAVGTMVIETACHDLAALRAGGADLRMAINLSTRQLRDPRLVDRVADSLVRHDLDPGALVLEITESVLLDDGPRPRDAIAGLRRLGVGVAIDDFGTGFSSLAYLSRMPVDELKIDRSFVAALGTDGRSTAIVKAMIAMAHALDLRVVAEGVERSEQFERLRDMGCDYAQGHLWSRPRKPTGLARWVRARAEITRSLPPG